MNDKERSQAAEMKKTTMMENNCSYMYPII